MSMYGDLITDITSERFGNIIKTTRRKGIIIG